MSIMGADDRVYPYRIYPFFSGSATGGNSDFYTFYTKDNNSFVLANAGSFSNIYYSNGTGETSNPKFNYASYNKDSDVVAMYGYPYVRALKPDGEKLWDKHIYNDLNLNQNPALAVIGNGVLIQYRSMVKKVDFSGNISDFIDFSETGYPNATIKVSYFNPKNNKLYFFSGNNKIGIMK